VKSTALKFGRASVYWIGLFFAAAIALIDAAIWLAGGSLIAHMGAAGAALHAAWQNSRLDIDDPTRCLMLFRSNRQFGLIVLAGLLIDGVLP
jgi:4-hydroxybenzoate polyprenyltransferase